MEWDPVDDVPYDLHGCHVYGKLFQIKENFDAAVIKSDAR
ncbi:uncharacterized protein G2W53_020691 [Senna tora]|uniref:Uncharacterized protein n=1 Tax=Senna tora TaxID=362788 RepID=A0A834WH55_9FABA|nr:uncharacterized protein G2W53_020691 [Senna tora]